MRDHRKLTAFQKSDALAISIPANIVECCARTTTREYLNHVNIALGSAAELGYLLDLAGRIYPLHHEERNLLPGKATEVVRLFVKLVDGLRRAAQTEANSSLKA